MRNQRLIRIQSIAFKELRGYFYSPVAYVVVISIFLVVAGWFFFNDFFLRDNADMRKFFALLPWLFTFIIPAITMGTFAEEHSRGSYEMLVTLPIDSLEVVIGKFLGAYSFVKAMLLPIIFYALCIEIVGDLEWGPVIGGFISALLLGWVYLAIGIFTSSITKNQIIAFILSVLFCFFLTGVDGFLFFLPKSMLLIFQYVSANYHFSEHRERHHRHPRYFLLRIVYLFIFNRHA